jgi:hypothetical protein
MLNGEYLGDMEIARAQIRMMAPLILKNFVTAIPDNLLRFQFSCQVIQHNLTHAYELER